MSIIMVTPSRYITLHLATTHFNTILERHDAWSILRHQNGFAGCCRVHNHSIHNWEQLKSSSPLFFHRNAHIQPVLYWFTSDDLDIFTLYIHALVFQRDIFVTDITYISNSTIWDNHITVT
jgi:hypothetical protein